MLPSGRIRYEAGEDAHDDIVSAKLLETWGIVNGGMPGVRTIGGEAEPTRLASADEEIVDAEVVEEIRGPDPNDLMLNPAVWGR